MTAQNQTWEMDCYGMTEAQIEEQICKSLTAKISGQWMAAMSVLSDAQSMMEWGDQEQARKLINVAKYIISEKLKDKDEDE